MNMWEREARDIKAFIERHGYTAEMGADHVVVKDPVQCSSGRGTERVEYKDIKVRDWPTAMRFVNGRS